MKRGKFYLRRDLNGEEMVEFRLEVIKLAEHHGIEVTKKAFGVSKSTIYRWKKMYKDSGYNPTALRPLSRRPKNPRKREWDERVIQYIKDRREECPRLGQIPLKKELDMFCKEIGIKAPSASTIARIIKWLKDRGEILDPNVKVSLYGKTGKLVIRKRKREKKLRRGHFYPKLPGDLIQIDSIVIFLNGVKMFLISGIDVVSRFGFSYAFPRLSSRNAREFMEKFLMVDPCPVRCVQTDNGSEFAGEFEDFLRKKGIIHFYTHPKRPQENSYVERFQRTIQEYFIDAYPLDSTNIDEFNKQMMLFLLWYNASRPHTGLNRDSPLEFIVKQYGKSPKESQMLWNYTNF
jgi:transposase InsO family protein/transposase-like protein